MDASRLSAWESALEVFLGDTSTAEARIYLRLPLREISSGQQSSIGQQLATGLRLTGTIRGPWNPLRYTLQATIPLREPRASALPARDPSLIAEAVVPDPCPWSPREPFLYLLRIELRQGETLLGTHERAFGIRPLWTRSRQLLWQGKPWTLRAWTPSQFTGAEFCTREELSAWAESAVAPAITEPDSTVCRAATEAGVPLLAFVEGSGTALAEKLRALALWPAVVAVILRGAQRPADDWQPERYGFWLGCETRAAELSARENPLPSWAQFVRITGTRVDVLDAARKLERPVIASPAEFAPPERTQALAALEAWQSQLEWDGEFAGFLLETRDAARLTF